MMNERYMTVKRQEFVITIDVSFYVTICRIVNPWYSVRLPLLTMLNTGSKVQPWQN